MINMANHSEPVALEAKMNQQIDLGILDIFKEAFYGIYVITNSKLAAHDLADIIKELNLSREDLIREFSPPPSKLNKIENVIRILNMALKMNNSPYEDINKEDFFTPVTSV